MDTNMELDGMFIHPNNNYTYVYVIMWCVNSVPGKVVVVVVVIVGKVVVVVGKVVVVVVGKVMTFAVELVVKVKDSIAKYVLL